MLIGPYSPVSVLRIAAASLPPFSPRPFSRPAWLLARILHPTARTLRSLTSMATVVSSVARPPAQLHGAGGRHDSSQLLLPQPESARALRSNPAHSFTHSRQSAWKWREKREPAAPASQTTNQKPRWRYPRSSYSASGSGFAEAACGAGVKKHSRGRDWKLYIFVLQFRAPRA